MTRWALTVSSEPASEPITAAEAKAYARVDIADDDAQITSLIKAARREAEAFTRRAFVTTTFILRMDEWPDVVLLPRPPAASVTSIEYRDLDDAWQTMDATDYVVDSASEPARIVPATSVSWPSISLLPASIRITYTAGYGAASAVPEGIKFAISAAVQSLYDERGLFVTGTIATPLPFAARHLLEPYIVRDFALTQGCA